VKASPKGYNMAEVKIYRAAYVKSDKEDSLILFSNWVISDGIDEVTENLETSGSSHDIVGWEEKILDTEPI